MSNLFIVECKDCGVVAVMTKPKFRDWSRILERSGGEPVDAETECEVCGGELQIIAEVGDPAYGLNCDSWGEPVYERLVCRRCYKTYLLKEKRKPGVQPCCPECGDIHLKGENEHGNRNSSPCAPVGASARCVEAA